MQKLKFKLRLIYCLFFIIFQLSCKTNAPIVNTETPAVVNSVKINQRNIIAKDLLTQKSLWGNQCKTNKIDLFCWLENKNKITLSLNDEKRLRILQGPTSATEIQVVVSLPTVETGLIVRLFDRKSKQLFEPFKMREASREFSDIKNVLLYFNKLQANKNYELLVAASDGVILDEREVHTFPEKIKDLKFAVVSCANDMLYKNGGAEMWEDLWSMQPDFILEIGDNSYADTKNGKAVNPVTEQLLWERYLETRGTLAIYKNHHLIPTIAIWDDHDYGANDGDRTFEVKEKSLGVFKDFFAQDDMPKFFENGPGISSSFVIAGQRFLLMDGRYFRSVNKPSPILLKEKGAEALVSKPDNSDFETHFGKEGESFLFKNLNQENIPTWLATGDQFFGAYHKFESYEGNQPNNFKTFLDQLSKAKSKVVFLSGDRHLSELMEIDKQELGYQTYEVTSSGIHATVRPEAWAHDRNPRQLAGVSGFFNYTIIESQTKKNKMQFKVMAYKANKAKLYEKVLKLGE